MIRLGPVFGYHNLKDLQEVLSRIIQTAVFGKHGGFVEIRKICMGKTFSK